VRQIGRFQSKLVSFILSVVNTLDWTNTIAYGSVMFYSTGPWSERAMHSLEQALVHGLYCKHID